MEKNSSFQIIPVARILMQTKKKECYITALEALKGLVPGFNPRKVNCDFEPAQYRAWKTCFPGIRIRGCLFHYSKASMFVTLKPTYYELSD